MKKYKINDECVFEEVEGEVIILDYIKGETIKLDQVSTQIWLFLKKFRSLDEIEKKLQHKYDNIKRGEIEDLLKKLEAKNLVLGGSAN